MSDIAFVLKLIGAFFVGAVIAVLIDIVLATPSGLYKAAEATWGMGGVIAFWIAIGIVVLSILIHFARRYK